MIFLLTFIVVFGLNQEHFLVAQSVGQKEYFRIFASSLEQTVDQVRRTALLYSCVASWDCQGYWVQSLNTRQFERVSTGVYCNAAFIEQSSYLFQVKTHFLKKKARYAKFVYCESGRLSLLMTDSAEGAISENIFLSGSAEVDKVFVIYPYHGLQLLPGTKIMPDAFQCEFEHKIRKYELLS